MIAFRMIIRLVLRALLASLSLMVLLVLIADFLESAGKLTDSSSIWNVLFLFVCKIPSLTYLVLPVAFVVGTSMVFAAMGRHGELRALAASGLGPADLLKPILVVGLLVAISVFLLGESLVPVAADEMERLMEQHFGRIDSSWRFFRNHQWIKGEAGRLIRVGHKSQDGKTLDYVIVLQLDEEFHVSRRLDARQVVWRDGRWIAERVERRRFKGSEQISYQKKSSAVLAWTERPVLFRDFWGRPQQKTISQLLLTMALLHKKGVGSAEYSLELHRRFSYPLMGMLLVLLLFPWLCEPVNTRSTSAAIIQATGAVFAAYLIVVFCTTAVSGGLFSPIVGAWLPPVLFLLAGVTAWMVSRTGRAAGGMR